MGIAKGVFSLICSKCGKQHHYNADDSDFDLIDSNERGMGPENHYAWEHSFVCDGKKNGRNCGNEIEVEYGLWEYPVGAFNMDDVKISGGKEVQRFNQYDFFDE